MILYDKDQDFLKFETLTYVNNEELRNKSKFGIFPQTSKYRASLWNLWCTASR